MRMLHPFAYKGHITTAEREELLQLVNKYGEKWIKISLIMEREPLSLREAYHQFQPQFKHGKWSTADEERFYGIMHEMGFVDGVGEKEIYWPEVSARMKDRSVNSCLSKWYGAFGISKRKLVWTPVVDAALVLAVREDGGEVLDEVEWLDCASTVMYVLKAVAANQRKAQAEERAAIGEDGEEEEGDEEEDDEEEGGAGGGEVRAPLVQGADCRLRVVALARRAKVAHLQRDVQMLVDHVVAFMHRVHDKYGDVFKPVQDVLDATRAEDVYTDSDSDADSVHATEGVLQLPRSPAAASPAAAVAATKAVPSPPPVAGGKRSRSASSSSDSGTGSSSSDGASSTGSSGSSSSSSASAASPPAKAARGAASPAHWPSAAAAAKGGAKGGNKRVLVQDDDSSGSSSAASGSGSSSGSESDSSASSASSVSPQQQAAGGALSSSEASVDDDSGLDSDEARLLQAARRAHHKGCGRRRGVAKPAKSGASAASKGGTILNDSDSD